MFPCPLPRFSQNRKSTIPSRNCRSHAFVFIVPTSPPPPSIISASLPFSALCSVLLMHSSSPVSVVLTLLYWSVPFHLSVKRVRPRSLRLDRILTGSERRIFGLQLNPDAKHPSRRPNRSFPGPLASNIQ